MTFAEIVTNVNNELDTWHNTYVNTSTPPKVAYVDLTIDSVRNILRTYMPEVNPNNGLYLSYQNTNLFVHSLVLNQSFVTFKIKRKKCSPYITSTDKTKSTLLVPFAIELVNTDLGDKDMPTVLNLHDQAIETKQIHRTGHTCT